MYLARKRLHGITHYCIRESYPDGDCMRSRDLFDLGARPDRFIIYPGGNSFYFHEEVYTRLYEKGVSPDEADLEKIFWPFLPPETRRVIEGFTHKGSSGKKMESGRNDRSRCETEKFHIFDMRRVHYLRFAQLDQSSILSGSPKIFRPLLDKSRDEIEQMFFAMESVLKAHEKKIYAYVIFDIPGHFSGGLAKKFPQALPQEKVDDYFLAEVCRLHADKSFWAGMARPAVLNEHLVRYVCWFFDHDYADSRYLDQLVYDWMARHRDFHPPRPTPSMPEAEALTAMGVAANEFAEMTVDGLTRQYRQMARQSHPDTGGGHDRFIRLRQAFELLLSKIRAKGKSRGYRTQRG